MKTSNKNITSSSTIHGVVLDGADVRRILDAVARLDAKEIAAIATRIQKGRANHSYAVECGVYQAVADDVVAEIRAAINGADLSCAKCEPDCMDVRVCDECRAEFYEDDGVRDEAGDRCDACERERYRQGALEAACHVPMPTDSEAAEMRRLKGME